MRITGGEFGGRQINGSPGSHVRPTTDMARTALFNILQNHIDFSTIKVLDLFAGTGIIALEFLSRGAQKVDSVDLNTKSISFMKKRAEEFKIEKNWNLIKADALNFAQKSNSDYDIIFADPPYQWPNYPELIKRICENSQNGTLIIIEHEQNQSFNKSPFFKETRKYGQSAFSFFEIQLV